jgi:hypothetical protein
VPFVRYRSSASVASRQGAGGRKRQLYLHAPIRYPYALTEIGIIRKLKSATKAVKVFDSGGLYLLVNPNGSRYWRLKYRIGGKEKLISLGTYPTTSLKDARLRRNEARLQLSKGIDPSAQRRAVDTLGAARRRLEVYAVESGVTMKKTPALLDRGFLNHVRFEQ